MNFLNSDNYTNTNIPYQSSPYSLLVILVIFVFVFYFTILRPQQKRTKMHKELINSISKGDEVLTTGGLVGRVVKIADTVDYISIELNNTNEIIIKRDFIVAILPKGTMKAL